MATKVNYGWLKTYSNEYFAPKTLLSQIYTDDGTALKTFLSNTYAQKASAGNTTLPIYMDTQRVWNFIIC